MILQRAAVVLVEPWEPGNVGAVARAMNNLGARDLRLVVAAPEQRRRLLEGDARRLATHGGQILERARFFSELPDALADTCAAYAFSARTGRARLPRASLEHSAREMAADCSAGRVALLFGTEERGLSSEHLLHATALVRIPGADEHPVFNLGQAVLLGLWELRRALCAPDAGPLRPAVTSATLEERQRLRQDYDELLAELGYGRRGPGTLHHRILRRFLDLLTRAGNERDDLAMLRGIARAVRRRLRAPPPR